MKLSAPKQNTFYISIVLAVIALIGFFVAALSPFAPWILLVAYIVLAAGNLLEGV